jgi:rhodanese-related sulfurtransferase
VLTGDTLFLGDIGRPDLMASKGVSAAELAGMMYDSLRHQILPLPDETIVYPAHGAGSACGKNISNERSGTLGQQKKLNWALQPMSKEYFVKLATADLPRAPVYFPHAARANVSARATLDEVLEHSLFAIEPDAVLAARAAGATLLDVREPEDFARGHVAGSVSVGLSGKYAHWCGTVLDRSRPIVLIAPAGKEREAAMRLARVGLENVQGYARGGFEALARSRPDLVRGFRRHTPESLAAEIAAGGGPLGAPVVLDVRQPGERAQKRIAESRFVPLDELLARTVELPREQRIVVHCAGGYRSVIAASLLENAGFERVEDLAGGMSAWEASHQPVTTG